MRKNIKTKKNIKTLVEELNTLKKQLSEDYLFGDGEPEPEGMNPEMMQKMKMQHMMGDGDSKEEVAMHAHEIIEHEPIIGKIRETAIEGLKKYADHPTSSIYEFFKKVFLESDKVLTDTGGKK